MSNFKNKHTFDKRKSESKRILERYPDRYPIIVEKDSNCKVLPDIDKNKYLVPQDLTIGQFSYVIRKRLKIKEETAIFLFHEQTLPPTSEMLQTFLKDKQEPDGFYYFTYSGENAFGSKIN
tara:strand:+ start:148 stop:510 length:363 start_codon:yes stop_codon:yes gene_type:complete